MRRLPIILTLCAGCFTVAGAQSTFTERLQQRKTGEGIITITQDRDIEELVNGPKFEAEPQNQVKPKTTTDASQKTKISDQPATLPKTSENRPQQSIVTDKQDTLPDSTSADDNRKKVMKGGYKINGYRVQVFAGGNSRNARLKAEKAGKEINSLFPGEPVYVHFYSPRWICRMGNYRTYEEAHQMLNAVKKLGYNSAIIVKGKITVPYLTPSNP